MYSRLIVDHRTCAQPFDRGQAQRRATGPGMAVSVHSHYPGLACCRWPASPQR